MPSEHATPEELRVLRTAAGRAHASGYAVDAKALEGLERRLREGLQAEEAACALRKAGGVPYPKTLGGLKAKLADIKNDNLPPGTALVGMVITTRPLTGLRGACGRAALKSLSELGHVVVEGPDFPAQLPKDSP